MTAELRVCADAGGILRNVLNYFSDEYACIQELLQNARRAEASEVSVEIDRLKATVTVADNGHGVIDPQDLLNLGKSEWADAVATEQPAGMGLFSAFKIGGVITVRSKDWRLTMDYAAMCNGKPAALESGLPAMRGTEVKVSLLKSDLCGVTIPRNDSFANAWRLQAQFMPFRTVICNDGKTETIERFEPLYAEKGVLRVETGWGFVDIHTAEPERRPSHRTLLVQQGVATTINCDLGVSGSTPWVRIHARPGTVGFTLPDRDAIIRDERYDKVIEETKRACVDEVIRCIGRFTPEQQRTLANVVYSWHRVRAIELPEELQEVSIRFEEHYIIPMTRKALKERLAAGALASAHGLSHSCVASLIPRDLLDIASIDVELFKAMFPDVSMIQRIAADITPDERGELLWRCGPISLEFENGEIRTLPPVPEQAIFVESDFDEEFRATDAEMAKAACGALFAIVHSCEDAVMWPHLDRWYEHYDEEMNRDESEALWRTSEQALQVASTWPGVPAADVAPDELIALLRDRLADGKGCEFRFSEASFELDWDYRLSIQSMLVEVVENGKTTRKVRLTQNCGYLQEVTP
jgi:hypothetical protein